MFTAQGSCPGPQNVHRDLAVTLREGIHRNETLANIEEACGCGFGRTGSASQTTRHHTADSGAAGRHGPARWGGRQTEDGGNGGLRWHRVQQPDATVELI
jgi:hypothetical protein